LLAEVGKLVECWRLRGDKRLALADPYDFFNLRWHYDVHLSDCKALLLRSVIQSHLIDLEQWQPPGFDLDRVRMTLRVLRGECLVFNRVTLEKTLFDLFLIKLRVPRRANSGALDGACVVVFVNLFWPFCCQDVGSCLVHIGKGSVT